jgi:WD40 repeat protein
MATDLEGRSLLIHDEQRRYRIHDLYLDYLRHAAAPLAARHAEFVARYRSDCASSWDTCPDDGYILRHLPWHLREAEHAAELRDLLFQSSWLRHKLAHTDINAVVADYGLLPDDAEAATLAAALTLSAHVLAREPNYLGQQLLSRLAPAHGPTISRLLVELRSSCGIAPELGPYLAPPGAELRCFQGHADWVLSVAVLLDGRCAPSGSGDATLRLWDLETGAELRRFEGHTALVTSVAVLPDGRRALSGSGDQTLRLWDIETGTELRRFEGHIDTAWSVAVLPDGHRALSGSFDNTLRLWDLETGAELHRFEGHAALVLSVAVVPDGRRALSGSDDQTLRLWDLKTGAELRGFEWHTRWISSVAMLPDGRRVLSGSDDRTLSLWDLEKGAELHRFEGHASTVTSVAVLPDGRRALSGSNDATLRLCAGTAARA